MLSSSNTLPRKSIRHCIRSFTPAWFTINMGTGTVSILAAAFYFGRGGTVLKVLCTMFFLLNLVLYIVFVSATIARFWMYPKLLKEMILNTTESLFIGAFPIGTATLIDAALVLNQIYGFGGRGFMYTLWAFWWLDLLIAYITAFGMIFVMMYTRNHMISETTSLWVLPIIPLIVASATGGSMSRSLMRNDKVTLATLTTVISLVSLAIGLSLTMMVITLFLTRLILRGPPRPQIVVSGFIVTSPLGTAGYSLLLHGATLAEVFPGPRLTDEFPHSELSGQILFGGCVSAAFVLWSMGICWILISIFAIVTVKIKNKIPFTLTYWGAVFPNGVFCLCTVQLGIVLHSPFFNYFGVVWTGIVLLLWILAFVPTLIHTWDTSIFPESTPDSVDPRQRTSRMKTSSYHATEPDV